MQNITGNGSYILEYGENIIPIIVTSEMEVLILIK